MLGDSSPPSFKNALPRGWYEGLILGSLPGQTSSARTMRDAPSRHADTKKSWKLKNLKNFNLIFSKCDDGKNRGGGSVGGEQQSHIMIISSNPL